MCTCRGATFPLHRFLGKSGPQCFWQAFWTHLMMPSTYFFNCIFAVISHHICLKTIIMDEFVFNSSFNHWKCGNSISKTTRNPILTRSNAGIPAESIHWSIVVAVNLLSRISWKSSRKSTVWRGDSIRTPSESRQHSSHNSRVSGVQDRIITPILYQQEQNQERSKASLYFSHKYNFTVWHCTKIDSSYL